MSIMKLEDIQSHMVIFLLMVVVAQTIIIALLVFFALKKVKKFKKAEENFNKYLQELDRTNYRLKKRLASLESNPKLES